jgi:tape measure domain-containing protein
MTTERIDIIVSERGSRVVRRNIDGIGGGAMGAARGVRFLMGALAGLGAAFGAREILRQADTYTLLTNRLKLVTSGTDNLARINEELYQSAQRTRTSYEATVDLYSRVARNADALGLSQQELLDITETVNQAIRVSGGTAMEAEAGVRQFGQAIGSGALRGDELISILENMPRLAQAIAEGMGVTIGQLRDLGAEGALTSDKIMDALQQTAPEIAAEFAQLTPTVGEAFTVLSNSALRFIGQLNETLGVTDFLANALTFVGQNLQTIARLAGVVGIALAAAFSANMIGSVALLVRNLISMQIGMGASSVATAAWAVSVNLARKAMWGLNAAMLANPIGLVVAAIAAIVAALFIFRDSLKVTSDGVVSLGDVFRSVFSFIMDFLGPVIDWFGEAWETGLDNVGGYVGDLLDVFVTVIGSIIDFVKTAVNTQIGLWVGAFKTIVGVWNLLPEAFKALGAAAINGLIDIVDKGVSGIVKAVAGLLEFIGGAAELVGLDNPFVGLADDFTTGLDKFKIQGAGVVGEVFGQMGTIASGAFSEALNTDYIGTFVNTIMSRAREIAEARAANTGGGGLDAAGPASPVIPDSPSGSGSGSSSLPDALQRQVDMLEEIDGPLKEYEKNLKALDALMAAGAVTTDEYRTAFRDLRIEFLDTQTTLESGMERTFLKIARDAEDAATQIEDLITNAFSGMTDALVDFVKTGKLDFSSLIDGMIADLVRLMLQQQIMGPLAQALGGIDFAGMFGFATGGTGTVGQTGLGFATAGGFTVPGNVGAVDSTPVNFMASPGERVSVTRPGEIDRQGGQKVEQNVQVNVMGGGGEAEVEEREGADGSRIVDVFINRSRSAAASDISRGGTDLNRAIERRYGLNPAAGNKT